MKLVSKVLAVVIILAMALSLVPALEAPVSAAGTPVLVLSSTTAVNPILDHTLAFDTYSTGGPFTVTFQWKSTLRPNDTSDTAGAHGFVGVTGTVYGTTTSQAASGLSIKGTTAWETKSFTFQNVGTYPMSGTDLPGNILRFGLWKAAGDLYIKNLTIKNAAGTVLYNLNTDTVVAQAVTNMQANGLTECDLSELAAIDYEHCPWNAGQFSTGNYTSSIQVESSGTTSTTTIKKPPVNTTSSSTTKNSTTSSSTTKNSTTSSSTTKQPPKVTTSSSTDAVIPPVDDNPTSSSTDAVTPPTSSSTEATSSSTQATTPSTTSSNNNTNNGGGIAVDPIVLVIFVLVFAVGICVVVLYATGAFSKKKK